MDYINRYECGCERGGLCTRTTMCAIQTALEDAKSKLEELNAVVEAAEHYVHCVKMAQHGTYGDPKKRSHQNLIDEVTAYQENQL